MPIPTISTPQNLLPDLWLFRDICNVYVFKQGDTGFAIDFGSGAWLASLPDLGIKHLTDVFLTHHHSDQCYGLEGQKQRHFKVHAPRAEKPFLDPEAIQIRATARLALPHIPFPDSYDCLKYGLKNVCYDIAPNSEVYLNGVCVRVISTPGHGPYACSYIVEIAGKQVCFSGDAVHAGATLWQPYNLEWDHWTGTGTLAAWEGICRLQGIGLDLLCPSHGPVIREKIPAVLSRLGQRLLAFYRAKGSICQGTKDRFVIPLKIFKSGTRQILPNLYAGKGNAYVLLSSSGRALLVDPSTSDLEALQDLLKGELGGVSPEYVLVTHAHGDHYSGIPDLQKHYNLKVCLHPRVAEAVQSHPGIYRLKEKIKIDCVWPDTGEWSWQEYVFKAAPWPGQTWWHCVFMTEIDGHKVLFGGDSFQPASRWNGTGGFCALNLSRFQTGFIPSAELLLLWRPDMMACGHRTVYRFSPAHFKRVVRWARQAEQALIALCPTGDLEQDYYQAEQLCLQSGLSP